MIRSFVVSHQVSRFFKVIKKFLVHLRKKVNYQSKNFLKAKIKTFKILTEIRFLRVCCIFNFSSAFPATIGSLDPETMSPYCIDLYPPFKENCTTVEGSFWNGIQGCSFPSALIFVIFYLGHCVPHAHAQ